MWRWLRLHAIPGKDDDGLDEEMRFHVDQLTSELIATGLAPCEARRQAHIQFGGIEQIKQECRDIRPLAWLESIIPREAQIPKLKFFFICGINFSRRQSSFSVMVRPE